MASITSTSPILTCGPSALRAFLGRPANLPQISNPELELEIVKAPPEVMVGERIEFRITAYGFKQRATHEYLTTSDILILESQIDGPLRAWQHAQKIEIVTSDSCRLIDDIEFQCPGGMLGYLLTESRIKESLEEGMDFRYSTLQDLINSGAIA
jgi:ligand-binding SRPBCC domain-containing protein